MALIAVMLDGRCQLGVSLDRRTRLQRTIVAVGARAEERDEAAPVEGERVAGPWVEAGLGRCGHICGVANLNNLLDTWEYNE